MNFDDVRLYSGFGLKPKKIPDVRPGQLWQWQFNVGTGWWSFRRVTSKARLSFVHVSSVFMNRGDVFTIVATEDDGPFQLHVHSVTEGLVYSPPKRWHVVLIGDTLAWIEHPWLEQCELLTDVV